MLIDWFTVFAEIINFLILVWLLKKFLYKPILNAIDTRENLVKTQLSLADDKILEAQKKSDLLSDEKEAFESQRETLLKKATEEAESMKLSLTETVKNELERLTLKQKERLKEEENFFKKTLIKKTQTEVFKIARKTLSDLATENLENHIVDALIQKLESLEPAEKALLVSAFKSTHHSMLVRSTLEISKAQENKLIKILENLLNDEVTVGFEINSDLVSGIELVTDGYKLSWNIDEYLTNLSTLTSVLSVKSNDA